eukprot:3005625-Pleurochrysis_carterae.AAC.1
MSISCIWLGVCGWASVIGLLMCSILRARHAHSAGFAGGRHQESDRQGVCLRHVRAFLPQGEGHVKRSNRHGRRFPSSPEGRACGRHFEEAQATCVVTQFLTRKFLRATSRATLLTTTERSNTAQILLLNDILETRKDSCPCCRRYQARLVPQRTSGGGAAALPCLQRRS